MPEVPGNVMVVVPATAGADNDTEPLVLPAMTTELMLSPYAQVPMLVLAPEALIGLILM